MPKIKVDYIVSFSSEDPKHVASNILSSDPAKKWKCKETGERSATIILQLERASVISAIDIGNENSAYIEVLASRSATNDDYKVLLVMSSFMTPLEARQSTNVNKVRMFGQDQLSKPECEQKWDRIKVVCTQPFNRHVQYGLSFITFHSPEEKTNGTPMQTKIGKFTLRPESPDNLSVGSLFARRKEFQQEPLSAAAAIREASSTTPLNKTKIRHSLTPKNNHSDSENKPLPRNRNEVIYDKDDEKPHDKIDKIIEKKLNETLEKKVQESEAKGKVKDEKRKKNSETKTPIKNANSGESNKRKGEPSTSGGARKKIKTLEKPRKPFNELLRGVVLTISGIQNPDRANLRAMALAMGAKYKPDWDNSCTHLICAFTNTPKFNQVKGHGKIVKRDWIEECHSQRKRLPWRRFHLDKNDGNKPESEDEIWEEVKVEKRTVQVSSDESGDEEGFDDTKMQERIAEIQARQNASKTKNDTYLQDTEDESEIQSTEGAITQKLPDFFDGKSFYIDEQIDKDVSTLLERYIIAYKGIIVENPSTDVDLFITSEENVENLRDYNPTALFVRPDWLWDCHNSQSYVSPDQYKI